MKKNIVTLRFASLCCLHSQAQYKMDLKDVTPPKIQYLDMGAAGPKGKEIRINNVYWEEGGIPKLPVMGEFHYNRMDERYWRESLMKMKATGIDIVSTYNLWILHEEFEGRQHWGERNNLRKFVELCHELGLKVHLRIGPYCNAEIRNGGFPDWIEFNNKIRKRTNDPLYLEYVRYWYKSLFNQVKGLLYKDGGPIVGIQLENEYVTEGLVVSHILALKKIAVEEGFDVPVYSMTHWMMSDYPKKEVIPYAGYYLETPWISHGNEENPTTPQEFFTYNRISENIGNDFIKTSTKVESLDGANNESPYFTCEVGLGTPNYYMRRAVVPEELAGETINLRLGCGVNLMGYYMYVGQTNPIGQQYTTARQTARVSNDYQAPIREFGTLGVVMKETKKLNYFMNDFGAQLAPMRAYLPIANKDKNNLQWAVRSNGESGFVFCSNYLYKHDRKMYKNVQFTIELKNEKIQIPRKKTTVLNGSYFLWPFNMDINGVMLQYATAQPICSLTEDDVETIFFFSDDEIPAEFNFKAESISEIKVNRGKVQQTNQFFFIDQLEAGKDCSIEIKKKKGGTIRLIVLTEKESDQIWKGEIQKKKFVALSESAMMVDMESAYISSESEKQTVWNYKAGRFAPVEYSSKPVSYQVSPVAVSPLQDAASIRPIIGKIVQRSFNTKSLSQIERAYLRFQTTSKVKVQLNKQDVKTASYQGYQYAEITKIAQNGMNDISFELESPDKGIMAEIEVLLEDGTRWVWSTDRLWRCEDGKTLVQLCNEASKPLAFSPEEHLSIFNIQLPSGLTAEKATRLYVNATGDIANAYIGSRLIHDVFINGADWIIGMNRYTRELEENQTLTIRIDGLKTVDIPIYFEKNIAKKDCLQPVIRSLNMKQEYVVPIQLFK